MRNLVDGCGERVSVVGEADSRDATLLLVDQQCSDIVLLDIRMPVAEGLRTIRDLRRSYPALAIVVCSFDLDPATAQEALAEGAHSCLPKPARRRDLLAALEAACCPHPLLESPIAAAPMASVC